MTKGQAPEVWGYVYTTLHLLEAGGGVFDLSAVVEPRIEPEVAFGLARSPEPGMDERALLGCAEWVAHGFEVGQSLFPGWRFGAADTVAAFGLHGALLLGERVMIGPADRDGWHGQLGSFSLALVRTASSPTGVARRTCSVAGRWRRCATSSPRSQPMDALRRSQRARSSPPAR